MSQQIPYWDDRILPPKTKVLTRDGYTGVIKTVLSGPRGTWDYLVDLDDGQGGGGQYRGVDVQPIDPPARYPRNVLAARMSDEMLDAQSAAQRGWNLASMDYPEFGDQAWETPDHLAVTTDSTPSRSVEVGGLFDLISLGEMDWIGS